MDPFTQKLLDRTRQRREILQKKLHENNGSSTDSVGTSAAAKLLDQVSASTDAQLIEGSINKEAIVSQAVKPPCPVPAPRTGLTPEKRKIAEKENSNQSSESSSVKARIENMKSSVGANQKRDQWESAVNNIMNEEDKSASPNKPQGSRFASLAAKINSWEEEAKISADANPLNAAPTANDRPPTGVSGKPSPFESPVARVQQRLSVNSSSTPNAARGIQFGARPVAPPSNSGGVDAAPSKPPRIPDSPSRTGHGTSSHEPGVFQSPPRSSAMNVKPPSPSQSKLLTTKPVSPKMKALQANLESKMSNGWQESEIAKKAEEEKKQDMKSLFNRWEKASVNTEPPKPTPGSSTPRVQKVSTTISTPTSFSVASSIFAKKTAPPHPVSVPPPMAPSFSRSSTTSVPEAPPLPPSPQVPPPASPQVPPPASPQVPPPASPQVPPPASPKIPPPSSPPSSGSTIPALLTPSKSRSRMMELALKSAGSTPPKSPASNVVVGVDSKAMEVDADDAFDEMSTPAIGAPTAPPRKRKSDRGAEHRQPDNPRFSNASRSSFASDASSMYETSSEARSSVASYREGDDDEYEDDEYDDDGATTNTEDEETEEEEVTKVAGRVGAGAAAEEDENISDFLDAAFDGLDSEEEGGEEEYEEDEDRDEEGAPPMKKQASESRVTSSNSSSQSSLQTVSSSSSSSGPPPSGSAMRTPSKNALLKRENSTKPIVYSVQDYRTMQRKKMDERPYLETHVIRESEHFYALKADEASTSSASATSSKPVKNVQQSIKELQEKVQSEQVVIAQASKALNAALQRPDFHGSMEMVECNRLLLLACQKRQACLEEIGRLKTLGWGQDASAGNGACRGTVTVSDIRLPLKPQFLQTKSEGLDTCIHYYICMIKHGPQLIHTQMLSTLDGLSGDHFYFSNRMIIRDIPPDFELRVDVYGLEVNKKSHAQKLSGGGSSTPKKSKTPKKNKLLGFRKSGEVSGHQSPINSFNVSTTSFTHLDSVAINAKSLCHDKFALSVSNSNPLSGVLYVKIQIHTDANVEERGFLNMFEDVSGLGAWHRRWIVLSGYKISYWKYPDDENKKPPMGTIDLMECVSPLPITIISREICARPNTFALETIRPGKAGETETLVLKRSHDRKNTMVERLMVSADTKEDRVVWCNVLNKALNNLRMWNPNALRPMPKREDCKGMNGPDRPKGVPV